MTRGPRRQEGFALLIVLWTLGLLALLGTQLLATSRQDAQIARNLRDTATLEAAANGAMQQAIFRVLDRSSGHWNADGMIHVLQVGRARVTVQIEDEADKVNPSIASPALLQALLLQVGADPAAATALAANIVEWRQANNTPGRPNPVVARYAGAGREVAPLGEPFTSIEELGSVLGMTPELLARLRPHLALFTDSDPGAGTRDPIVARALAAANQFNTSAEEGGEELVSIIAKARGRGNAHYGLRVVVRTNGNPVGRRYEILSYEQLWNQF
jgi:general secretion pathway protein K